MALNGPDDMMAYRNAETVIGLVLSAVWLVLLLLFWLLIPGEADMRVSGITRILTITGIVMPLALIWMGVWFAVAITKLRHEAAELRGNLFLLQEMATKRPKPTNAEPVRTQPQPAPVPAARPAPPPARPAQPAT